MIFDGFDVIFDGYLMDFDVIFDGVLGDFNLPDIDWDSNVFTPCGRYPSPSKAMMEIALDFNLQQVVLKPTRDNSIL